MVFGNFGAPLYENFDNNAGENPEPTLNAAQLLIDKTKYDFDCSNTQKVGDDVYCKRLPTQFEAFQGSSTTQTNSEQGNSNCVDINGIKYCKSPTQASEEDEDEDKDEYIGTTQAYDEDEEDDEDDEENFESGDGVDETTQATENEDVEETTQAIEDEDDDEDVEETTQAIEDEGEFEVEEDGDGDGDGEDYFTGSMNIEHFSGREMKEKALSLTVVLRSVLFACLFYILAHPDTRTYLLKNIKCLKEFDYLTVSMVLFLVFHYVLSIFV
jgi:hypothetical protein